MKLSKLALLVLRGDAELRDNLRKSMGVSIFTIKKWVRENDDNLTKASVLQIISRETGLSEEQLLEQEPVKV